MIERWCDMMRQGWCDMVGWGYKKGPIIQRELTQLGMLLENKTIQEVWWAVVGHPHCFPQQPWRTFEGLHQLLHLSLHQLLTNASSLSRLSSSAIRLANCSILGFSTAASWPQLLAAHNHLDKCFTMAGPGKASMFSKLTAGSEKCPSNFCIIFSVTESCENSWSLFRQSRSKNFSFHVCLSIGSRSKSMKITVFITWHNSFVYFANALTSANCDMSILLTASCISLTCFTRSFASVSSSSWLVRYVSCRVEHLSDPSTKSPHQAWVWRFEYRQPSLVKVLSLFPFRVDLLLKRGHHPSQRRLGGRVNRSLPAPLALLEPQRLRSGAWLDWLEDHLMINWSCHCKLYVTSYLNMTRLRWIAGH